MYTTLWEIPALAIINELRSRAAMKTFGPFALDVLYARAKAKMWAKTERLRAAARHQDLRFRHPPPALASSGSAGAWRR